jgi:GH18 family chitinase
MPMDDVIANIDYLNVMCYTFTTVNTGIAAFTENLHDNTTVPGHTRASVDDAMRILLQEHHVPPAKILLGINFWATRFRVNQLGDKFPAHNREFVDNLSFPQIQDLLHTGKYTNETDPVAGSSYLVRNGGGSVIVYEDPSAVRAKCELAKQLNCAGVMIWHIGSDNGGGETPLLSAIDESFGMPKPTVSAPALQREIALLGKHPVPPGASLESLVKMDADLRAKRGAADDEKWAAGAVAAMKSANP